LPQQISISDQHMCACMIIRIQNRGPESSVPWSYFKLCFELQALPVLSCCPMLSSSASAP